MSSSTATTGAAAPSTAWREVIGADEALRHAEHARRFVELQQAASQKFGDGRALHRRGILALRATLHVPAELPAPLRHGLFAAPSPEAGYDVWIRLSNGSAARQADARPDVRGLAFKVHGVAGEGALGKPTTVQDFALINRETFAFRDSTAFVGVAIAASRGPLPLLRHLIKQHGLFGGLGHVARLKKAFDEPFAGFAVEPFYSAAPIACGPYAAKVRLLPRAKATAATATGRVDWRAGVARHLAAGAISYQLQLQLFVDEARTPIEDPTVPWPQPLTPYLTVAELTIPTQPLDGEPAAAFTEQVEQATFDPWSALAAHRPLGEIMRARKVTYYESQKARGAG
jgi:catalase